MGKNVKYPDEWNDFLKENSPKMSRKELTKAFNSAFNQNKTELAIKSYCNNRGFNSSNNGKFAKGDVSWAKGLSGEDFKSHYTKESYEKHKLKNEHIYAIGDEIVKNGIPYIVTSIEPNKDFKCRLTSKRRVVWEKQFGKIPQGCFVVNLDGNQMNCDIKNLICVSNKFKGILAKNRWYKLENRNPEIFKTAVKWCEFNEQIKEFKKEIKNECIEFI